MLTTTLLLSVQSTVPQTPAWSPTIGLIMILCNLFAIALGYFAIQNTGAGPDLPVPQLASRKSFGIPELLATTSFGHILGAGVILGLANAGAL